MLMEQLTNVRMEKYEALEKVKKSAKDVDALKGKCQAFEMALQSAMEEKDKAAAAAKRAQGMCYQNKCFATATRFMTISSHGFMFRQTPWPRLVTIKSMKTVDKKMSD